MYRWLNRVKTPKLPKGKIIVLNIFGFIIPVITILLIPQMVRESLILWLGKNMFLYVLVCLFLGGVILLNVANLLGKTGAEETLSLGVMIAVFLMMLFGSYMLGLTIQKQSMLIDGERHPGIKNNIIRILTARFESEGAAVDCVDYDNDADIDAMIVTAKFDLSEHFDDVFGYNTCAKQSQIGRRAFEDYGFDVDFVYQFCNDDGKLKVRAFNGILWPFESN